MRISGIANSMTVAPSVDPPDVDPPHGGDPAPDYGAQVTSSVMVIVTMLFKQFVHRDAG